MMMYPFLKKAAFVHALLLFVLSGCQSQSGAERDNSLLGGPCEGCEAVYEYEDRKLDPVDTLPEYRTHTPKLKLTGTVYQADGKTPAPDVILYIYHTNRQGIYETRGGETGWGRKHGHFRAWVKTGEDGRYTFYTFRPGAYPSGSEPEHIHLIVKEPGKKEYYLDSFHFDDDPLLTPSQRERLPDRGGSGIVQPRPGGSFSLVERDIFLGKNIPHYP